MRKLKDAEIVFVVYTALCLMLGFLVLHYRNWAQYNLIPLSHFGERNIEFTTDFYGLRYQGVSTNLIDAHVLYFGAFEKPMLHWIRDLSNDLQRDHMVFLDVGANTGHHTLFMSQLAETVHSFEPYPPVLVHLRAAVESNELSNVVVHPVGLGSSDALVSFFEPPADNLGTGSFVRGYQGRSPSASELQIVAGDAYLDAQAIAGVDFIKLDVEGYEKSVLDGLRQTLLRDRPIVLMELSVDNSEGEFFQNRDELVGAFPERYSFALMAPGSVGDLRTGRYEVSPLGSGEPSFADPTQHTVIAYPDEVSGAIQLQ